MKIYITALFILCATLTWAQPVINTLNPIAAAPGGQVTISGQGFHPNKDSNFVYFGALRASLVSASSSTIIASVPFGATYDFVTVTSQKRTAFSKELFLPSGGAGEVIKGSMMNYKFDFNQGNFTIAMAGGDFDNNGTADLVVLGSSVSGSLRVLSNSSTAIGFNFLPIELSMSAQGIEVAVGDINSDGKLDIAVTLNNFNNPSIAIFLNTSDSGVISFAPELTISTPFMQAGLVLYDFDNDGKQDFIVCNHQNDKVSVLRNVSVNDEVAFDTNLSFDAADYPARIQVGDFDGDGQKDILVINLQSKNLSLFKNLSIPGNINLGARIDLQAVGSPANFSLGDINKDGKLDFIVGCGENPFSMFVNNSSNGNISFNRTDLPYGISPVGVDLDDLDGDGWLDIVVSGMDNFFTIYQNAGNSLNLSFRDSIRVPVNNSSNRLMLLDLNNNGQPEVVLGATDRIVVFANRIFAPVITSFTPASGTFNDTITLSGRHFTGTTEVSVGAIPVKTFIVLNDSTLQLVLGIGTSSGLTRLRVVNKAGEATSTPNFTYIRTVPFIQSVVPSSAKAGEVVTILGNNFDTDPLKNLVKFETATAQVLSATATQLTVRVPTHAGFGRISVTRNVNTGYAPSFFIPAFAGSPGRFPPNMFEHVLDSVGSSGTIAVATGDFNADQKNDLAVLNTTSGRLGFYHNISTDSGLGFAAAIGSNLSVGVRHIELADFHGDGQVNFAVANTVVGGHWINSGFSRNYASMRGPFPVKPFKLRAGDFNNNGTPDMALLSKEPIQINIPGKVSLIKTEGFGTGVSFQGIMLTLNTTTAPTDLVVHDFDGDTKPDFVVADSITGLSVFRNIATTLDFAFATRLSLTPNTNIQAIAAIDFDKDNKIDLLAAGINNNLRLYRNTSTPGNISFEVFETNIASAGKSLKIADLDGDGFADAAVAMGNTNEVIMLRNAGQWPQLFSHGLTFFTKRTVTDWQFADMDGDSKPDMVTVDFTSGRLSVYKNQIGGPANFYLCSGKSGNLTGDVSGSNYTWQVNTDGTGFNNITDDNLYEGFNTRTITIKQATGSLYGYRYRLIADGNVGGEYVLKLRNEWMGTQDNNWANPQNWSCNAVPDASTDVLISSGTVTINSPVVIRTLQTGIGVNISLSPGSTLTVLK